MVRRLSAAKEPPWLHGEVARRMAERLAIVKLQPAQVLDWWPRVGGGAAALVAASKQARVRAVESEPEAPAAAPWWSVRRWAPAPAPLREDDVPDASAQLVWANMMLHALADPLVAMRRWQRALQVDGFLMFSTLGPGTLPQLRKIYAAQGWGPPMGPLVDMHDLGDMLVQAGFADPVMDQEIVTLTWASATGRLGRTEDAWRERGMPALARAAHGALAAAADAGDGRPGGAKGFRPGRFGFRDRLRSRIQARAACAGGGGIDRGARRHARDGACPKPE